MAQRLVHCISLPSRRHLIRNACARQVHSMSSDTQHAIIMSHYSLMGQWVTVWPTGVMLQAMLMYGIASLASFSAAAAASCISRRACHGASSSLHHAFTELRRTRMEVHDRSDQQGLFPFDGLLHKCFSDRLCPTRPWVIHQPHTGGCIMPSCN